MTPCVFVSPFFDIFYRCWYNYGGVSTLSLEPADDVDLPSMTKAELLEYAEANGIDGVDSSMLKADIYEVIVNNM